MFWGRPFEAFCLPPPLRVLAGVREERWIEAFLGKEGGGCHRRGKAIWKKTSFKMGSMDVNGENIWDQLWELWQQMGYFGQLILDLRDRPWFADTIRIHQVDFLRPKLAGVFCRQTCDVGTRTPCSKKQQSLRLPAVRRWLGWAAIRLPSLSRLSDEKWCR